MTPNSDFEHSLQRIERLEREVERLRNQHDLIHSRVVVSETLLVTVNDTLREIKEQIKETRGVINRVGYVVVSGIIIAVISFIVKGGLALV